MGDDFSLPALKAAGLRAAQMYLINIWSQNGQGYVSLVKEIIFLLFVGMFKACQIYTAIWDAWRQGSKKWT